jgi:hypothetical protein
LICIGLDVEFLKATGDVLGTRINRDWTRILDFLRLLGNTDFGIGVDIIGTRINRDWTRILGFFEIVGEHGFWD